jgi:hypothetical protein
MPVIFPMRSTKDYATGKFSVVIGFPQRETTKDIRAKQEFI